MSQHTDPPADASVEQQISVDARSDGDSRIVTIAGEVDMLTTPLLRAQLRHELDQARSVLIIDLSRVDFLGSSGLAVLVETKDSAALRRIPLRLVCSSREVIRPLVATGLHELFDIRPDLPAAVAQA